MFLILSKYAFDWLLTKTLEMFLLYFQVKTNSEILLSSHPIPKPNYSIGQFKKNICRPFSCLAFRTAWPTKWNFCHFFLLLFFVLVVSSCVKWKYYLKWHKWRVLWFLWQPWSRWDNQSFWIRLGIVRWTKKKRKSWLIEWQRPSGRKRSLQFLWLTVDGTTILLHLVQPSIVNSSLEGTKKCPKSPNESNLNK